MRISKTSILLALTGLALTAIVAIVDYVGAKSKRHAQMARELENVQGTIEIRLQQYLLITLSLEAFTLANLDLFESTSEQRTDFAERYLTFAESLELNAPSAMSLQLAPQGIVTYLTQAEKNSGAIGFDLLEDEERRAQIFSSNRQRKVVMSGPLELVQGGEGLVVRKAIFTEDGAFDREQLYRSGRAVRGDAWPNNIASDFWGFATLVVDLDSLFNDLNLLALPTQYRYALKGRHGLGANGEVFWGDAGLFVNPEVQATIQLPEGSWILAMDTLEYPIWLRTIVVSILGVLLTLLASYVNAANRERVQANAASQANARLLASMSHELRTPMNGIIGVAQLMERTHLDEQQKGLLDKVLNSSKLLLRIVNDVLDFSKIDAKAMQLESIPFELRPAVDHAVGLLEVEAAKKSLVLKVQYAQGLPQRVIGDEIRVQQILLNLLSNAVKFTDEGHVLLNIHEVTLASKAAIEFSIEDTGIGIDEKAQKQLFQAFTQADSSVTKRHGGTGLGLVISQRLAEQMGGRLTVESTLGQGSVFRFYLPFEKAERPEMLASDEESESASGNAAAEHQTIQVLVVDDLEVNTEVAVMMLEEMNCEATAVSSAWEAIRLLAEQPFDVVLMDRQMPGMDGIEATRKIRHLFRSDTQPWIIAMTASAGEDERREYLESGANDFIAKPLDFSTLQNKIDAFNQRQLAE
ncbi:MAG: ATP-binding protein [Pseudohongiellaceae bacterium]|nr:ATP-binding protein [Pseudohongiellaceae bacterium]